MWAAVIVLAVSMLAFGSASSSGDLARTLSELDTRRNGKLTPFREMENRIGELLQQYLDPTQQSDIYFQLIKIYAESFDEHHLKIRKCAEESLKSQADPVKRARLYIYLGNSFEGDSEAGGFSSQRRLAATAYLRGYKELLAMKLPKESPPIPGVEKMRIMDESDREQVIEIEKRREEQQRAREEASKVAALIEARELFKNQLFWLYYRLPVADAELQQLTREILQDDRASTELTDEVLSKARAERERIEQARTHRLGQKPTPTPAPSRADRYLFLLFLNLLLLIAIVIGHRLRRGSKAK